MGRRRRQSAADLGRTEHASVRPVEVNEQPLVECGPGALPGMRAVLEDDARAATLRTRTACKVAVASADGVDRDELVELREGHRREQERHP
jgi:hypothetical protein